MTKRCFYFCAWRTGFWFRIFGVGLHVKLAKHHVPLFSERNGFRKAYYFAGLRFEFLGSN
jgi:hypothetical protein